MNTTITPPAAATPSSQWRAAGQPDPHGTRYDCERAALAMGDLTDDELANGAFMNYDQRPAVQEILDGKRSSPIAWMTAVKDRIRWLSRALEATLARSDQQDSLYAIRHPDDLAVVRFALVMRDKLAAARAKGRGGWEDRTYVDARELSELLRDHVEKGDPVDVANFAMMLQQRGESITTRLDPVAAAARKLQAECFGAANAAGWWHDVKTGASITENPYCFSNKLMLTVSELSEAMEGDRKSLPDDKLPHRPMREVELADAVIRIFDLAGGFGLDLAGAISEKLAFNAQRPDHKIAHRQAAGGKQY